MTEWPELVKSLTSDLRELRGGAPEVMKAFSGIAQAALSSKALALDLRGHRAAIDQGATREEISAALGMAIYMGAGPSAMYASHAFKAFSQFESARAPA